MKFIHTVIKTKEIHTLSFNKKFANQNYQIYPLLIVLFLRNDCHYFKLIFKGNKSNKNIDLLQKMLGRIDLQSNFGLMDQGTK